MLPAKNSQWQKNPPQANTPAKPTLHPKHSRRPGRVRVRAPLQRDELRRVREARELLLLRGAQRALRGLALRGEHGRPGEGPGLAEHLVLRVLVSSHALHHPKSEV